MKNHPNLILPKQEEGCNNSWHLYVVQVVEKDRKEVFDALREKNIGVNVHYIPVYKHPYYQENGYKNICCENAETYYQRAISLPIYPLLTEEQQDYVIEKLLEIVKE